MTPSQWACPAQRPHAGPPAPGSDVAVSVSVKLLEGRPAALPGRAESVLAVPLGPQPGLDLLTDFCHVPCSKQLFLFATLGPLHTLFLSFHLKGHLLCNAKHCSSYWGCGSEERKR